MTATPKTTTSKTACPIDEIFEARVVTALTEVLRRLCKDVPELRTVAVVFDWHGQLNRVAIPFLFLDEWGPIRPGNLSGMIGGLLQTPKLLEFQHELAFKNCAYLADSANQLVKCHNQASEAAKETAPDGKPTEAAGPSGGAKTEGCPANETLA